MLDFDALLAFPDVFFEDVEVPTPPPRTLLYGLRPIAVGTRYCESLKSFVCRLANEHRLSPTQLVSEVLWDRMPAMTRPNISRNYNSLFGKQRLVAPGKLSEDMVDALEIATGAMHLRACTLAPLARTLNSSSITSASDRFCPICVRQRSDHPTYGPLLWSVEGVVVCPIHGVRLLDRRCGAAPASHLHFMNRKILPHVCDTCGSVGLRCVAGSARPASAIDVWKAIQVADLIAASPQRDERFSDATRVAGLEAIVERVADGVPAVAARRLGFGKSQFWEWLKGKNKPGLDAMLHMCALAKVTLVSTLSGNPEPCDAPVPKPRQARRPTPKMPVDLRRSALQNALQANPPRSLTSLSAELGFTAKQLRNDCRDLCQALVRRHREFARAESAARMAESRKIAQKAIRALERRGANPTLRALRVELGDALLPNARMRLVCDALLAERRASA